MLLLAILTNASTGEVEAVVAPLPGFETLEQCEAARKALPRAPEGYKLRAYCVDPKLTFI